MALPVNDATVFLKEGKNSSMIPLELIDMKRTYATANNVQGMTGHEYTLIVHYNNKIYLATDTLPEKTSGFDLPIESIRTFPDEGRAEIHLLEHKFGFSENVAWTFNDNRTPDENYDFASRDIYSFRQDHRVYTHQVSPPQGVFPTGFSGTGLSGAYRIRFS